MRTPILAALLGLSLVGCLVGGDSGTSGTADDDDGTGPGSNPGTGSNPGSGSNQNPTPKVDVTVDKATISTELLSTNMVTVTIKGSGGFSGAVNLAGSVVDTTGAAIPGWTVTLDKTTVDMAADGTATAVATVKIPSMSTELAGTVKIDATSSLGEQTAVSQVTAAKQLTLPMTINGANCAKFGTPTLTIAVGTKVRWTNADAAKRITIHVDNAGGAGISGFKHEPDPGMAPLTGMYEQTANSAGTIGWYCHSPDDGSRYKITSM